MIKFGVERMSERSKGLGNCDNLRSRPAFRALHFIRACIFAALCSALNAPVGFASQNSSVLLDSSSSPDLYSTVLESSWSWTLFRASFPNRLYRNRRLLGPDRIAADQCTQSDISIFQGRSSPLPNGIPTYNVQIINLCVIGCPLSNIHISCGWFASAKLVNPKIFRRLGYNDCLVNDGKALKGSESINFQYANSFQYPMKVQSAETCS